MKRERDESGDLSEEQQAVLNAIKNGRNVFFTGSAGTGKTFTLRRLIDMLYSMYDNKTVHVTASTGIAATHIGGTTLHSFANIGLGLDKVEDCVKKITKFRQVGERWRSARVLIIDEVSMVSADFFTKLDLIAKALRANRKPFGGIQLVLSGDFLQLPSIDKKGGFLFDCEAWKNAISCTIQLTTVFRQRDAGFIALLQNIRKGIVTDQDDIMLRLQMSRFERKSEEDVQPTKLYSHRHAVDEENVLQLNRLKGTPMIYVASDYGPQKDSAEKLFMAPTRLTLKLHAQVILISNLDPPMLVNGSRGIVVSFDPETRDPTVKFDCGITQTISPMKFESKRGDDVLVSRNQIPLLLGWALSIHKSQGMTLDLMETDISKCWDPGQAYVALSRATALSGLRLLGYRRECIKADPHVLAFYETLTKK